MSCLEITWLGHSCVVIRSGDVSLITDPFGPSLGIDLGPRDAEIVTVSHPHPHHGHVADMGPDAMVIQGPGEYETANFYITGLGTDRNDPNSAGAVNTVYRIQVEDMTLCHVGDLSLPLSPRQVEDLRGTDVLFVPAGGVCTLDISRVAEMVNLIGPKIVVPVHYRKEGIDVELNPVGDFLEEIGAPEAVPQPKLDATSTSLPRELRVVVLDRAA